MVADVSSDVLDGSADHKLWCVAEWHDFCHAAKILLAAQHFSKFRENSLVMRSTIGHMLHDQCQCKVTWRLIVNKMGGPWRCERGKIYFITRKEDGGWLLKLLGIVALKCKEGEILWWENEKWGTHRTGSAFSLAVSNYQCTQYHHGLFEENWNVFHRGSICVGLSVQCPSAWNAHWNLNQESDKFLYCLLKHDEIESPFTDSNPRSSFGKGKSAFPLSRTLSPTHFYPNLV